MNDSTARQIYRMSHRKKSWAALLLVGLFLSAYSCTATDRDETEQQESAITGTLRTSDGSPQHGILVSATGEGQKDTTSVFSDDQGVYAFPPLALESYRVFVGTPWSERVTLTSSGATQDFTVELEPGFMNQTTGVSWFNLLPGTSADKKRLTDSCGTCHSIWRLIDRPQTTREGWLALAKKMARNHLGGKPDAPR